MNTILGFGVEDTGWRRHQKIAETEDGLVCYGPQDWNRRDKISSYLGGRDRGAHL